MYMFKDCVQQTESIHTEFEGPSYSEHKPIYKCVFNSEYFKLKLTNTL